MNELFIGFMFLVTWIVIVASVWVTNSHIDTVAEWIVNTLKNRKDK